jgi:hypothetical protein
MQNLTTLGQTLLGEEQRAQRERREKRRRKTFNNI